MLHGKKEEQNVDKEEDSWLCFAFLLRLQHSLGLGHSKTLSVLHVPWAASLQKYPQLLPIGGYSWKRIPLIWWHPDILKLHFHFLARWLIFKDWKPVLWKHVFSWQKDSMSNNTPQKLIISAVKYKCHGEWWFWE